MSFDDLFKMWTQGGFAAVQKSLKDPLLIPLKPWPSMAVGRTTFTTLRVMGPPPAEEKPEPPVASANPSLVRVVHTNLGNKVPAPVPILSVAKSGRNTYASVMVGRSPQSDVIVDQASVSRFHAEIRLLPGGAFAVRDAESRNGTTLNGNKVLSKHGDPLKAGDVVAFGSATCVFVPVQEAALTDLLSRMEIPPKP